MDSRNLVSLTGGLTTDPEIIDARDDRKIIKLRLAADRSGPDNVGYFDITFYAGPEDQNARFLMGQITEGKMKKGSQIQCAGRLTQERWTKDGTNHSKVVIVAESINYFGFKSTEPTEASGERAVATNDEQVPVPSKW